jgi:hypothetical protein
MSGLQRATRHPDRINDPHVRALGLVSDGLLEPLDQVDADWLGEHLAACAACSATADSYVADAALLRGLRTDVPPVPRDLGARVSLALDDEVRRALRRVGPGRVAGPWRGSGRAARPYRPAAAIAGLAAAALVAVLVLPLALPMGAPAPIPTPEGTLAPAATPITVNTQPVAWVRRATDGSYVISSAPVDRVCAGVDATVCGTLDGGARTLAALEMRPSSVVLPRDGNPAVVVGQNTVYAVTLNLGSLVTSPPPDASSVPTSTPVQSPAATGEPASPPVDSPAPPESPVPPSTEPGSPEPTASAVSPSPSPVPTSPTPDPGSPPPTAEPASPEPATPLPTLPPATPAPSPETVRAIAEGVILVGTPPAYSPDGQWVAFSARPLDGSQGPDIYAWRVGDRRARVLTDDHGSIFSGWHDGAILASGARALETPETDRSDAVPEADADPASVVARSFFVDPARATITEIPRDGVWRPVVDPTDRVVVYWTGSLAWSDDARAWIPAAGGLVAAAWKDVLDRASEYRARPLPAAAAAADVSEFEVRFDPAGRRLGVWTADPATPGAGTIALVAVDDDATLGDVVLSDAAALPGFSLDADRLAWSTPPGRNGQGSLVTVYAWRGEHAGQLYSMPDPGDEPVVVAQ